MRSKTWLMAFAATVLALAACLSALNIGVDPFGVFGDRLYGWYAYDMTNNPRAAKLAYLDRHHTDYDSYVVGSSAASSLPVELLNEYTGARFYNLFGYGADMARTRRMVEYITGRYTVKNLIVVVGLADAQSYDLPVRELTNRLPVASGGIQTLDFTAAYLFADPRYALTKIRSRRNDTFLPQTFDVFVPETGVYDKTARDAEPIRSLPDYLEANPVFRDYVPAPQGMPYIEACGREAQRISELCAEQGIRLRFVMLPAYRPYLASYNREQVSSLAGVLQAAGPLDNFLSVGLSDDPRFFYDTTHCRNVVGEMAVREMYGDTGFLGAPVTAGVTVLTYHDLGDDPSNPACISPELFESHLAALQAAGYQTISLSDLVGFSERGDPLPAKPLLLTFDDGYRSNYTTAFPLLRKYGMKAVVFAIGHSVGLDEYKGTGVPIRPHFSRAEAEEMVASGLVEIQSHSYDLHQSAEIEGTDAREDAVTRLPGESETEYIETLRADWEASCRAVSTDASAVFAFAYPRGRSSLLADAVLRMAGVKITLTTNPGVNTVIAGLPQSLLSMNRFTIPGDSDAAELLEMLAV